MKVETLINHELFKNKSKLMNTRFPVFNWCDLLKKKPNNIWDTCQYFNIANIKLMF